MSLSCCQVPSHGAVFYQVCLVRNMDRNVVTQKKKKKKLCERNREKQQTSQAKQFLPHFADAIFLFCMAILNKVENQLKGYSQYLEGPVLQNKSWLIYTLGTKGNTRSNRNIHQNKLQSVRP